MFLLQQPATNAPINKGLIMSRSERVQGAMKKAQRARHEAKGKKGYVDKVGKDGIVSQLGYLNSQQPQKTMAVKHAAVVKARAEYALAIENLAVAEIDGEGLEAAKENVAVTELVLRNNIAVASVKRAGASLTAAGGA